MLTMSGCTVLLASGIEWGTVAPYVAAGVALLIGILAPILSARTAAKTARQTFQNQRELANDDRLWRERATTYVSLLRWAGEQRNKFGALGVDDAALDEYGTNLDFPLDLAASLTAYASGAVYAAARDFRDAVKQDATYTASVLRQVAKENAAEHLNVLYESAARLDYIADRMAQLVSDDLHGLVLGDYGRPLGQPGHAQARDPEVPPKDPEQPSTITGH